MQQKGSLVNDKILRFDFSHFAKMNDEELRSVEKNCQLKKSEKTYCSMSKEMFPLKKLKKWVPWRYLEKNTVTLCG